MLTTEITATMTSLDLVELINATRRQEVLESGATKRPVQLRHDNFMVKIEKHPGIDSPKFLGEYQDGTGRMVKCYNLPKRECELMVMSESPAVQTRVYDRMIELERATAPAPVDLNDATALRSLLLGYSEKVITLEAQVAADAPKVAFAEIIRAMDGVCRIGDFCKTMKAGRNKLFARMKADKILMENRMPYQKYIDKGYFSVIEQKPYKDSKGVSHPAFTTMVTGAGQLFLTRKYHDLTGAA